MSQVVTNAGEALFAQKAQANEQLDIDTFIFAYVPGQDSQAPVDRSEGLPPTAQQVHTQTVQQVGRINNNTVVYSTVLNSLTGPFEFNWVGLYSSVNNTLVAISHVKSVNKTITQLGNAGNTLNRNFAIEYSGISDITGITVAPETWQLDFSARLAGMDELTQNLAMDMNGRDWFIGDGFKVEPTENDDEFRVIAGVGYVHGMRVELEQDYVFSVQSYPQNVYVDVWFEGDASSKWKPQYKFIVSNFEEKKYVDASGANHNVFKLSILNSSNSDDLRSNSGLKTFIEEHVNTNEKAHPASAIDWKELGDNSYLSIAAGIFKHYNVGVYGVSTSNTPTENRIAIQELMNDKADKSYIVKFVFDFQAWLLIDKSLIVPNNVDIEIKAGTRLTMPANSNRPIFISKFWYQTIESPDDLTQKVDYLGIHGGGEIFYSKGGTAPGGMNRHAICVAGAKRLFVGNNILVGGAWKYCYMIANVDYLTATNLRFDNDSDGLHLQPPIYHAYVRNLRGRTGDDMFALTGGDYPDYDVGTRGAFTFIDAAGLYCDNSLCAVKLTGDEKTEFKHISVKGIYGTVEDAVIRIWADGDKSATPGESYLDNTKVKYASFSEIGCIPGNGYPICEVHDLGTGDVVVDKLKIYGISTSLSAGNKKVLDVKGSVNTIIYHSDIEMPRDIAIGVEMGAGAGNDNSRIFELNLKLKGTVLIDSEYSSVCLVTRGVLDSVKVQGNLTNKSAASIVQQRGGTVKKVNIANSDYKTGNAFKQYTVNVDGSEPTIDLSSMQIENSSRLAIFAGGGTVLINNVKLPGTTGHQVESTGQGIIQIHGYCDYGNSLIPSTTVAGRYFRAYGFGLPVDASVLQRTGNQHCNNVSASFGAGRGLVGFADGIGWKNIITGDVA